MKEKQKVIDRNGWQAKLYKFTYGCEPNYRGYCPFFWMTMLALLLLPLTLIGHIFDFIIDLFKDLIPEKEEKQEKFKFENYKYEYEPVVNEVKANKLKDKVARASEFLKHLVFPALIFSVLFAAYLIYKTIDYVTGVFSLADLFQALIIAAVCFIGFYGLLWVWGKVKSIKSTIERVEKLVEEKPAKSARFNPLSFFGALFTFIVDTFKVVYEKKCPLIVWSDETKPIEKIKND